MAQQDRITRSGPSWMWVESMSEPESHTEHQAALEATLFRDCADADELVLELKAGELRVRGVVER